MERKGPPQLFFYSVAGCSVRQSGAPLTFSKSPARSSTDSSCASKPRLRSPSAREGQYLNRPADNRL